MVQRDTIREMVETAVAESFDEHVRTLLDDIVDRVMLSVVPSLELSPSAPSSAGSLNKVVAAVQSASQQVDILKHLLEGAAEFSARAALFILRGSVAVGWQARGFASDDAIKAITVNAGTGIAGAVVRSYQITSTSTAEFCPTFDSSLGAPLDGRCVLVPLIVRGKVAALLYADSGDEGVAADIPSLELLARASGDWIELQALRKAAGAPAHYPIPSQTAQPAQAPNVPVPATVPLAAAAGATTGQAASSPVPQPQKALAPVEPVPTVAAKPAPEPPPAAPAPPEPVDEEELHKKARRFAKLLVDEIVLYNQHKVKEGRQNQDLYDRLKDDIDKSRATYDKRYAQTPVSKSNYFTQALVAGLADNKPALLGSNFPR